MPDHPPVQLSLHYQYENCHPDGKIKVGIAADAPWREERMSNALEAMRLLADIETVDEVVARFSG